MPKRIYLDTNHWIKLHKLEQGTIRDTQLMEIYTALKELAKSDKIRVLFFVVYFIRDIKIS